MRDWTVLKISPCPVILWMWTSGYQIFSKQNMPPSQSVEEARAAAPRGGTAWERPPLPALRTARRRWLPLSLLVDLQRPGPTAALAPWCGCQGGRRWAKSTGGGVDGWFFLHPFAVLGATLCFINQCCKACEVFGFNEPPKSRILSSWYWRGFTCGGDWVPSLPGQLLPRDLLKRKGRCHGRHDFKKNGVHSGWIQNQTLAHPITAPGLVPIAATCRLLGLERSLLRTCWVPQWRENEKAAGFCRDCRAYVFIRKMCAEHCRACFDVSTCYHFMKSFFIIRSWSSDISSRQDVGDQGFSYQISADDVMKLQILVPSKSWPILTQNAADPDLSWAAERTWSELLQYLIAKVEVKLRDAFRLTSQHFRPAFGLVRLDPAWRFYIQLDAFDQIAGENQHCGVSIVALF